jgi:putative ATPase
MTSDLFSSELNNSNKPLAAKMRPLSLNTFVGQSHLLAPGMPLYEAIVQGKAHSMILWGPPGVGKTTIAQIIAHTAKAQFISLSAVMSGVKEIRTAIKHAQLATQATILFIDEVHRFNKGQQDAFLPYVEDGTVTFIGATTENPSFELNNALLSRARVYQLKSLEPGEIMQVIENAILDKQFGFGTKQVNFATDLQKKLVNAADGDARRALNLLDLAIEYGDHQHNKINITEAVLTKVLTESQRRFDKGGDIFHDQISALHKSVRGSSPDGALYWFARMLDGGCDPLYIARRVVRMASEDIGNADPRGLQLALNAWDAQQRLGSPEGELAIAQALCYLASAPKSNAVYTAFHAAMQDAQQHGSLPVPQHICNAPTKLMRDIGNGIGYRYDHDEPNAVALDQTYFPEKMGEKIYYQPVDRGLEIKIKEKLDLIRKNPTSPQPSPAQIKDLVGEGV